MENKGHGGELKFSQRLESQHQEKTLLLRGAALASLFTIHKIQVSLSNSVQAFHISVVVRQTGAPSPRLSFFGFPVVTRGTLLQSLNTLGPSLPLVSIVNYPHVPLLLSSP